MLRFIKEKALLLAIRRNKRLYRRTRKVYNLNAAQSVGIVFDATDPKAFEIVEKFYKQIALPGKTVRVAGYVHDREIPNAYLFKKNFHFFHRKNINWYRKPLDPEVVTFLRTPFQILIDLTLQKRPCLRYIVDSCPASFKVGRYTEDTKIYDLMISLDKPSDLPYFVSQVTHYLQTINRPELSPNIYI